MRANRLGCPNWAFFGSKMKMKILLGAFVIILENKNKKT